MNDDDALLPPVGRYGEHVRGGGASFRCAACREMAAVVRLVRAGTTVNMGPPVGEQAYDRDGVVVDIWLGATCWRRLAPARWARIEQVLAAGQPDPGCGARWRGRGTSATSACKSYRGRGPITPRSRRSPTLSLAVTLREVAELSRQILLAERR
jgi:hypothetical protein